MKLITRKIDYLIQQLNLTELDGLLEQIKKQDRTTYLELMYVIQEYFQSIGRSLSNKSKELLKGE